ncbi:MAG: L,D-transpeptidase family protein [Gemmatimonadaceae bacterium]
MLNPASVVAAALFALVSRDTSNVWNIMTTPTVHRAPVTGIKGVMVADSIVVEKTKHTLTLYRAGLPVHIYQVALGKQPTGDKVRIGDGRTPEGLFHIDYRNAQSKYHMSLHISYPDAAHAQRASALGVAPGGDIMIHGLPPAFADYGTAHREFDWTEGCIAVTDSEIEEIWRAVPNGAPIQIKP